MLNRYYWMISFLIGFVFAQDSSFTFQQNDYVNIQSSNTIQPENAMTIECWVNPDQENYDNFDPIIQYLRITGAGKESGFSIIYYDGMFRFIVGVGSGQNDIYGEGLDLWPGEAHQGLPLQDSRRGQGDAPRQRRRRGQSYHLGAI